MASSWRILISLWHLHSIKFEYGEEELDWLIPTQYTLKTYQLTLKPTMILGWRTPFFIRSVGDNLFNNPHISWTQHYHWVARNIPSPTHHHCYPFNLIRKSVQPSYFSKKDLPVSPMTFKVAFKISSLLQWLAFKHDAWRIWIQFVFQDAMAYVGLLLGIRSGDWDLMQSSLYEADGMFHCLWPPQLSKAHK